MTGFSGLLQAEFWAYEDGLPTRAKVLTPLTQYSTAFGDLTAPTGFVFDGASVPRAVRWVIDPFDTRALRAACCHDLRCTRWPIRGGEFHFGTWQDAHDAFREGCAAGGMDGLLLKAVSGAVHRFGPRWHRALVIPIDEAPGLLATFRFDWTQET